MTVITCGGILDFLDNMLMLCLTNKACLGIAHTVDDQQHHRYVKNVRQLVITAEAGDTHTQGG